MMFNNQGYSLSDIAAVSNDNGFGGNNGAWWIIILFLFCFMGNGWTGCGNDRAATANEVQNDFNFASLERQNQGIIDNIHQAAYDTTGAMKDIAYDINGEIKDSSTFLGASIGNVKEAVLANGYEIGRGFASVNTNIDSIRYDNAMNTKELLASNCAQTQKILDVLNKNKFDEMQNQINQLQL